MSNIFLGVNKNGNGWSISFDGTAPDTPNDAVVEAIQRLLISLRIACPEAGYPYHEAQYVSFSEYLTDRCGKGGPQ